MIKKLLILSTLSLSMLQAVDRDGIRHTSSMREFSEAVKKAGITEIFYDCDNVLMQIKDGKKGQAVSSSTPQIIQEQQAAGAKPTVLTSRAPRHAMYTEKALHRLDIHFERSRPSEADRELNAAYLESKRQAMFIRSMILCNHNDRTDEGNKKGACLDAFYEGKWPKKMAFIDDSVQKVKDVAAKAKERGSECACYVFDRVAKEKAARRAAKKRERTSSSKKDFDIKNQFVD